MKTWATFFFVLLLAGAYIGWKYEPDYSVLGVIAASALCLAMLLVAFVLLGRVLASSPGDSKRTGSQKKENRHSHQPF